jgi:hypothetical protein
MPDLREPAARGVEEVLALAPNDRDLLGREPFKDVGPGLLGSRMALLGFGNSCLPWKA